MKKNQKVLQNFKNDENNKILIHIQKNLYKFNFFMIFNGFFIILSSQFYYSENTNSAFWNYQFLIWKKN